MNELSSLVAGLRRVKSQAIPSYKRSVDYVDQVFAALRQQIAAFEMLKAHDWSG